ncbi:MAG: TonB-dependent receptor, partial [Kordiimonas sp.]
MITANKRPSANFNLPVSVSVVSALTLEDLSTYDFQSIAPHLAGVLTTNLGPGRNKIFVRGLSDGAFSDRTQSMVGVYIDETPVNYSDTNPDIRLFDVERIELLRGPQGTLYGSGSLAGVYRVITAKPKLDETSLRTRLSGSYTKDGDLNGTVDLAFNTPIIADKLGFRLTGYTDLRSGYIDDVEQNLKDVNSLQIHGLRPALRWQAGEDWTVDLVGNFQAIRYDDTQYYQAGRGLYNRDNVLREPYSDSFFHGNLTLSGTLGSMTLTSATAYVRRFIDRLTDASDGLPFIDRDGDIDLELLGSIDFARSDIEAFSSSSQFLDLFATQGVGHLAKDNIRIFSHETRVRSRNDGPFNWMGGVYYQGRNQETDALLAFRRAGATTGLVNVAISEERVESSDEFAVFGEATQRFTSKFSLTAGLRYSHSLLKLHNVAQLGGGESVLRQQDSKVKHSFIPKLALRYEWTEDIQSYGLISLGYRIGGLNINTPVSALVAADPDYVIENAVAREFQSDNLLNAEVGIKSYWFDRQLGVNLSAFMVKLFDIQSDQIGTSGLPLTVNVGEARIRGYEAEVFARPFSGFEILGSLFWNDSELRSDNAFLGAKAGDRLPAVPENSFSFSALYEFALEREWTMILQSGFSYIGRSALNFNEASSAKMGGYGMLNAKVQFA